MGEVVSFDGTRVSTREWGPVDAPLVVLVHGLGMSVRSYGDVPRLLADRHRVVAYDLRGHARSSSAPGADYSLDAHARDLRAVLQQVAPDRRAVLVGHSFGGAVIVAHLRRAGGERVAGAVFVASAASAITMPGLPGRRLPPWARSAVLAGWLRLLRVVARAARAVRPVGPVARWFVRVAVFPGSAPTSLLDQVRQDFMTTPREVLARTTLASVRYSGPHLARDVAVPGLVLRGEHDREVSEQEAKELVETLPGSELVTWAGAAHMLPLTHPGEVAEQVARWVRRTHGEAAA